MVGFNKTKSELGTLQDALAKTQIDLEKTNFELHAKKSELLSLALAKNTHDTLSAALYTTRTLRICCSGLPEQICDALWPVYAQPCDCLQLHQPAEGSQSSSLRKGLLHIPMTSMCNMNMGCCGDRLPVTTLLHAQVNVTSHQES